MKPVSILLVDDNEGDILLTREALSQVSIPNQVCVARDGQEAIWFLQQTGEFANAQRPDLILLDINMPRLNGQEVLSFIKNDQQFSSIPVVMFSSSNSPRDVKESYQNSANSYITKPLGVEKFEQVIEAITQFWFQTAQLPGRN